MLALFLKIYFIVSFIGIAGLFILVPQRIRRAITFQKFPGGRYRIVPGSRRERFQRLYAEAGGMIALLFVLLMINFFITLFFQEQLSWT